MSNPAQSLYEWFDARADENLPQVTRVGSCYQLVHALDALARIGVAREEISAFVEGVLSDITRRNTGVRTADEAPKRRRARGLLRLCPRCHPPTGVEQKTIGILRSHCDACGVEGGDHVEGGPELLAFSLRQVLARLADLESRA